MLAHFRGNATARTRERARLLVAGGRLSEAHVDASGASATIEDDSEVLTPRLVWSDVGGARCGCTPFRRKGTCPHLVAVLEMALAALAETSAAPTTKGAPDWLRRLESMTGAIEGREGTVTDPWRAQNPADFEVRYVLRFADRRGEVGARLECQVRRGGASGRWVAIPFTGPDADDVDLAQLGPAHARVAAIATGAPEASWLQDPTHRAVSLATVGRAMARPLLAAARDAAPLVLAAAASTEPRALALDLDRVVSLELEADAESVPIWTIRGWLRVGDRERIPASSILQVATDGICVIDTEEVAARVVLLPAGDASSVAAEFARAPLEIPRSEAPSLSAVAGAAVLVGPELAEIARPERPTPSLRAESPLEAEGDVRVDCHITFDYGGTSVRVGDRTRVIPALDGRSVPRQPKFEAQALARFRELGGRPVADPTGPDAAVSAGRFLGLVSTLVDEGWHVVARDQILRKSTGVDVSITSGVDWFDLVGAVKFGDEEIPFPVALRAAQQSQGFVTLGDGSRGMLPESWLERWRLASFGEETEEGLRFDRTRAWILAELVEEREAEVDDPFQVLRERMGSLGAPHPEDPPATFTGELRPYQRDGLGWLRMLDRVGLCGCLADDMGLGKTIQILAYLLARAPEMEGRHALVVAPRSLVFNWLAEAGRFAPSLPTVDFSGPERWTRFEAARPGSLLVTTYGALRNDAERLAETELDLVILDEAQAIKSRRSQTALAARALKARRRVTLTGTPVENHLGELWSQLEFLNPGMLGAHTAFEQLGAPRTVNGLTDEGRSLLARALKPFLLRRTKDAVLDDLPPKTEQILRAPLAGAQETTYTELSRYYRSELMKSKGQKRKERLENPGGPEVHVLAALTRLRQAACHPGLVEPALLAEGSGKLDLVLPMLEELVAAGRKAIVFSSFTRLLGLVRTRLETARVPYLVLDGQTRDRGALVDRFQTCPDGTVFLISVKAGGAGLNLTAADYVFLLDPWWNPAVEAQAIDRAHRMGRTRPVHVYRVLTENTIEARVVELQEKKADLARAVLDGAATTLSDLGPDDLAFLLS